MVDQKKKSFALLLQAINSLLHCHHIDWWSQNHCPRTERGTTKNCHGQGTEQTDAIKNTVQKPELVKK